MTTVVEDTIKMNVEEIRFWGFDLIQPAYDRAYMSICCEQGNESLESIKRRGIFGELIGYKLLQKDCNVCGYVKAVKQ